MKYSIWNTNSFNYWNWHCPWLWKILGCWHWIKEVGDREDFCARHLMKTLFRGDSGPSWESLERANTKTSDLMNGRLMRLPRKWKTAKLHILKAQSSPFRDQQAGSRLLKAPEAGTPPPPRPGMWPGGPRAVISWWNPGGPDCRITLTWGDMTWDSLNDKIKLNFQPTVEILDCICFICHPNQESKEQEHWNDAAKRVKTSKTLLAASTGTAWDGIRTFVVASERWNTSLRPAVCHLHTPHCQIPADRKWNQLWHNQFSLLPVWRTSWNNIPKEIPALCAELHLDGAQTAQNKSKQN